MCGCQFDKGLCRHVMCVLLLCFLRADGRLHLNQREKEAFAQNTYSNFTRRFPCLGLRNGLL